MGLGRGRAGGNGIPPPKWVFSLSAAYAKLITIIATGESASVYFFCSVYPQLGRPWETFGEAKFETDRQRKRLCHI